jgi:hypothetical protein
VRAHDSSGKLPLVVGAGEGGGVAQQDLRGDGGGEGRQEDCAGAQLREALRYVEEMHQGFLRIKWEAVLLGAQEHGQTDRRA